MLQNTLRDIQKVVNPEFQYISIIMAHPLLEFQGSTSACHCPTWWRRWSASKVHKLTTAHFLLVLVYVPPGWYVVLDFASAIADILPLCDRHNNEKQLHLHLQLKVCTYIPLSFAGVGARFEQPSRGYMCDMSVVVSIRDWLFFYNLIYLQSSSLHLRRFCCSKWVLPRFEFGFIFFVFLYAIRWMLTVSVCGLF